jgi:hypothetical protein
MDSSLFRKIEALVNLKKEEKKEVVELLRKEIDDRITEEQVEIKGKKVQLFLSSIQKQIFLKKDGYKKLKEKGYELKN